MKPDRYTQLMDDKKLKWLFIRNISCFFMVMLTINLLMTVAYLHVSVDNCFSNPPCPLGDEFDNFWLIAFFASWIPSGLISVIPMSFLWSDPPKIEYLSKQPIPKIMIDGSTR